jgi:hypothetical protein
MATLPQIKRGYLKGIRGILVRKLNLDGTIPGTEEKHWIDTAQSAQVEMIIKEGETSSLRGGDRLLAEVKANDIVTGANLKFTDARFDAKATTLIAGGTLITATEGPDQRIIGWTAPTIAEQATRTPMEVQVFVPAYNSSGGINGYVQYTFYYGIGYPGNITHNDNEWSTPEFTVKCQENGGQGKSVYDKKFVDALPPEAVADASDTTAPTISSVTPTDGAAAQVVTVNVVWTFSSSIDPNTVTADNFILINSTTGATVPASVTYNPVNYQVTLDPTASLTAATKHIAIVTTDVKDMAGNRLASTYSSDFTTA